MTQVFVSIGNSDDKLSQQQWHEFVREVYNWLRVNGGRFYGEWYSLPNEPYQNMTVSADVVDARLCDLRAWLAILARDYRQDAIALHVADVELIIPAPGPAPTGSLPGMPGAMPGARDRGGRHAQGSIARGAFDRDE